MFIPPLNLGQFQPSPATIAEWVYQIWQFLQDNPIATETEIREFIQSELTQSETLANAIEDYLTENPPPAPVQSVQGKTGAVQLAYNDIVTSSNAVPVYKAASTPSTSTLVGQYNLGYRLFVNTTTQEVYTISPAGALSLVGRGKFDGTTVDLNTSQGDTTIAEAITELTADVSDMIETGTWTPQFGRAVISSVREANWVRVGKIIVARAIVVFGTSTDTGRIYVAYDSLPYSASARLGVFGCGRDTTDSDNNLILSNGEANNNVWVTTGAGGAITGTASSNATIMFTLCYTVS